MIKARHYCSYITTGILLSVILTACGSDTAATDIVSSTVPVVFYEHSVAIRNIPTLGAPVAWGYNEYGQLGNKTKAGSLVPVVVAGLSGMAGVSAGGTHTLALSDAGVWAWGNNGVGQLGNNKLVATPTPVKVLTSESNTPPLTNVSAVAAGGNHSLALDRNGVVWAWGGNGYGQLGDATLTQRKTAVQVKNGAGTAPLAGVAMIAAGGGHSLALLTDGTVMAWGNNAHGQLGNNATPSSGAHSTNPVPVVIDTDNHPLTDVIAIAAGGSHCLALDKNGVVWAWGYNFLGQLGMGSGDTTDRLFARPVAGFTGPTSVMPGNNPLAAGLDHSLALDKEGNVWAWGSNFHGQVGDGTLLVVDGLTSPSQVLLSAGAPLSGVASVVAIGNHSLAFAGARAWAWGKNTHGQLGDGTKNNSGYALPVSGFQ